MLSQIGARCDLFHTASGTAFADIMIDGHRETWRIRSKRFRAWLRRRYYEATGEGASAVEIRSALDLLEARAQFEIMRRVRLDLEKVHARILRQDPEELFDPQAIRAKARPGDIVVSNANPVFLTLASKALRPPDGGETDL